MLRIGVDLERLRNVNSGLGQFCLHLAENMESIRTNDFELNYFYPNNFQSKLKSKAKLIHVLDKLLGIRAKDLDLFHCTHQDSRLFPKHIPCILTIHDLNFLEKYSNPFKKRQKLKLLQAKVNRAKGFTFISEYSKILAATHLNLPNVPCQVIYNGNCLNANILPSQPKTQIPDKFLFTIGIINPKKNFHVLLPLVLNSPYTLVIAGNDKHPYTDEIKRLAKQMGISHKISILGAVTENEKLWLYQHCKAFVFPSLAEGFGLPVIEAMSVGKPVFLSNKTSLPEVGGDLAYYWKSFDAKEMQDVFESGLKDFESSPNKSNELIQWSSQFNWKNTAKQYLNFYSEVYNRLK